MVRDSQHAINLVPDKVFPNKATYKMAYKEKKELEKKMQEIFNICYIIPNISPCVILVLLTLKNNYSWCMCVDSRVIDKIIIK